MMKQIMNGSKKFLIEKEKYVVVVLSKWCWKKTKGICMNLKRIYRIMRKYNLVTKIRRATPYKHIAKATQEHKTCPNLLNRQFNQEEPEKSMLTDITYLFYGQGKKAYLSCVKDSTTREILAYHVSFFTNGYRLSNIR